jgi:hypothetical protein
MPVAEAGGPHMINKDDGQDISTPDTGAVSDETKEAVRRIAEEYIQKRQDAFSNLARTIEAKLNNRMGTRKSKENQWLEAMRIYLGSLSGYNIVTGDYPFGTKDQTALTHRPEFNFIRQKCNLAIAQTVAHQFAAGDKNWDIDPPKVIDLDPSDMQQIAQMTGNPQVTPDDVARIKADLMEREIEYHLDETNYALEARKALADRVILGTGVLKGPLNVGKLKKIYKKQQTSDGKVIRVPAYTVENTPNIYRVNPWYFFPDDSVTYINKAEDSIEAHPMSKQELAELIKHPGYFADQITPCLEEEPRQYTNSPFNDPAYLTQGINLLKNKYLVLEYHGPLSKLDLDVMGIQADDTPMDDVFGEVWIVNSRVIRLQLETIEGCNRPPYYCCVWEPDPATIYGFGIPMLARDQQRVVNESYKMILDNAGISAGPQVVVDTTIIKPADGGMECTPWKVWYLNEYGADASKAIQFFTPQNSFDQLSGLLQMAKGFSDEESSINLYMGNSNTPAGAMDSATGQALINENAMTPLFFKSEEWDDNITRPLIQSMYDWEMQYNEKDEIKGTYCIDVRTTTAYLKGQMDQLKVDRLFQEIAQGSPIGEWINLDELIQARLAGIKLPYSTIIKSPQQVSQERQQKAQQPKPPDPNMLKAQAMLQQNQIEQQRVQLDAQKLQFDQQRHQTDTQLQLQNQQSTNASKERQHALDVQKSAIQLEGIRTQAAVQSHGTNVQAAAQLQGVGMAEQTKKQLAGLKHAEHFQDLQVQQQKIQSQEKVAKQKTDLQLRNIRDNSPARQTEVPNRNLTKHEPK